MDASWMCGFAGFYENFNTVNAFETPFPAATRPSSFRTCLMQIAESLALALGPLQYCSTRHKIERLVKACEA
jgi:hypothetical protein